jgi:hypothetical protein
MMSLQVALETTSCFKNQPKQPTSTGPIVGYGPFSLCVIYNETLRPSSGGIHWLMMYILRSHQVHRFFQIRRFDAGRCARFYKISLTEFKS